MFYAVTNQIVHYTALRRDQLYLKKLWLEVREAKSPDQTVNVE